MADFKTHVTTSTVLGFGYAGAGMMFGMPLDAALVAGGLCGVSGMLPDIDSPSGRPIKEVMSFSAAVVPMFLMHRFRHLGFTHESIILIGGAVYLFIRFGVSAWLKRYTVHRGMFHSIPAEIIFTELGFLISGGDDLAIRFYKAGGVFIGFMSHLLLDEIYSIDVRRGIPRLKSSFGTAIKFWGPSMWGNISVYVKLILVTAIVLSESTMMSHLGAPVSDDVYQTARRFFRQTIREQLRPEDATVRTRWRGEDENVTPTASIPGRAGAMSNDE